MRFFTFFSNSALFHIRIIFKTSIHKSRNKIKITAKSFFFNFIFFAPRQNRVVRDSIVCQDYFIKSTKGVEILNCMLLLLLCLVFILPLFFINFLPLFTSSLLLLARLLPRQRKKKSFTNIWGGNFGEAFFYIQFSLRKVSPLQCIQGRK